MILDIFRRLTRRTTKDPGDLPDRKAVQREETLLEIPKYPPFMQGIPGMRATVDRILQDQIELIRRIRLTVGADDPTWEHYQRTLENYAAFVHLLPASERHHHRGAGGLLRHGLEAAAYATEQSLSIIIAPHELPEKRQIIEPRWTFGAFVSALCHDIGKPISDMEVLDEEGNAWNPMQFSLHAWLQENRVERYFLRWKDNRHKKHEALTGLLADRVIHVETRSWILEAGPNLLIEVIDAMGGGLNAASEMSELVKKADQASVELDLVRQPGLSLPDTGVPVQGFLVDAMRGLYRDLRQWKLNENGARLWFMQGALFVVWPAGGKEITQYLRDRGNRGIPNDPDTLAEILVERGIAVAPSTGEGQGIYWKVCPSALQKNNKPVELKAIRLSQPEILLEYLPTEAAGEIQPYCSVSSLDGNDDSKEESKAEVQSGAAGQNEKPGGQEDIAAGSEQFDGKAEEGNTGADQEKHHAHFPSMPDEAEKYGVKPATKGSSAVSEEKTTSPSESAETISNGKKTKQEKPSSDQARRWLEEKGLAGLVLVHLAEDVACGDKRMGRDLLWLKEGAKLAIRYPDAIRGYGVEPPAWMSEVSEYGWLEKDKYQPMKRVFDVKFGDKQHRCVILEGEVARQLSILFETKPQERNCTDLPKGQTEPVNQRKNTEPTNEPSPQKSATTQKRKSKNKQKDVPKPQRTSNPGAEEHDQLWEEILNNFLSSQEGKNSVPVRRNGKTLYEGREVISWLAKRHNTTRSRMRVLLNKSKRHSKRITRIEGREYIDVSQ